MPAANYVDFGGLRGYIIDVAALIFERTDGKIFLMNNGTGGSVATAKENVTISNGWISAPQAIIDTTQTHTISYTTNLTDIWMIAGMNNVTVEKKTSYKVRAGDNYEIQAGDEGEAKFVIDADASNIYIEGFSQAESGEPTSGKFAVTSADGKTTVTFLATDVNIGDVIPVVYDVTLESAHVVDMPNSSKAAIGKLTRLTPIYAEDDEGSDIKGYIRDVFYKVKVTGVPGFDQSYKSESSHTIEFQSIAPKAANAVERSLIIG